MSRELEQELRHREQDQSSCPDQYRTDSDEQAGVKDQHNGQQHEEQVDGFFDREEFLEEMIDAYNYFTAILVLMGVDADEFFTAYTKKHEIICNRLSSEK